MSYVHGSVERHPTKVLLTGFGPFRDFSINPSWELIKQFDGQRCGDLIMESVEIPVEYAAVDKFMADVRRDKLNDIALAIHCGVGRPGAVCLEQFARNGRYRSADTKQQLPNGTTQGEGGDMPQNDKCARDGPDMIETQIDLASVARRCQEGRSGKDVVRIKLSTDAGLYLCEYIYYSSMHHLKIPSVFVHVPPINEPYSSEALLDTIKQVIAKTVEEVCGTKVMPELLTDSKHLEHWVECFNAHMHANNEWSTAVAAIRTLISYIEQSDAGTLSELRDGIKSVIGALTCSMSSRITSVSSGCELFLRFITLKAEHPKDFAKCRAQLVASGNVFLDKAIKGRSKVAKKGLSFVHDGTTVLTHSYSRVVFEVLKKAAQEKKRFNVYVTESRPSCTGHRMATCLTACGIPVTVIPDAAVGHVIEKIDCCLVGAEAIVESGGIINTIGTYQMAVLSKATNTPFYAVGESFKFVRLFPLSQSELPPYRAKPLDGLPEGLRSISPKMDYTPPALVTLIITDIGVLTPSAVSDELIKLYC